MKHLAWLALTLALFAATLLLTEWSDTRDLSHQREWDVARADGAEGELDGLHFSVREARAVVVASKPDRALVLVRLAVQGSPTPHPSGSTAAPAFAERAVRPGCRSIRRRPAGRSG